MIYLNLKISKGIENILPILIVIYLFMFCMPVHWLWNVLCMLNGHKNNHSILISPMWKNCFATTSNRMENSCKPQFLDEQVVAIRIKSTIRK